MKLGRTALAAATLAASLAGAAVLVASIAVPAYARAGPDGPGDRVVAQRSQRDDRAAGSVTPSARAARTIELRAVQ